MKFENIKTDGMKHEYKVVFGANEIEEHILKAVEDRSKTFKMQGFRVGHVPINIVRNSVESSVIKDVFETLISKACDEIIKDTKTKDLASRPVYKFENSYEKGKELNLTLTIEAAPTFELKPYELNIIRIVPKVSEKEIEDEIKRIISNSPVYEKAEEGYCAKAKDEVSYKALCYNKGVESKKKSFQNTVIIPDVIPDGAEFLEKFVGKKVNESFDFTPATDKDLSYNIVIKSIKKAISDISDEDFAKKKGFKDLLEFNKAIKENLENDINTKAFLYHKNQILEALGSAYNFELPKGVVDQEMKSVIDNIKRDISNAEKKGEKIEKKADEELMKEYSDVVNKRVLLGYILNRIAKEEGITVSDKEIQNVIMSEINRNPSTANMMIEYYSKNPGAVSYKKAEIIEYKVIALLISKAKANDVEKTILEVEDIVQKLLED